MKAGAVKFAETPDEAATHFDAIMPIVVKGQEARSILVERKSPIAQEYYVGITWDGRRKLPVLIFSDMGGIDIEEVAEKHPEHVSKTHISTIFPTTPRLSKEAISAVGVTGGALNKLTPIVAKLVDLFLDYDLTLAEINPLVITTGGQVLAVDAKLNFDDDALFRQADLRELQDPEQEDPLEVEAREHDINYVKLDGDVGCIVNGAGLAMATMDVIDASGSAPANFLDIGGGADEEKVAHALRIVLSDPRVKRVLVNLFGGILRCDVAARGFLMAAEDMPHALRPMVVRMLGTNADEGRLTLSESGLDVTLVNDLGEAAAAIKASG